MRDIPTLQTPAGAINPCRSYLTKKEVAAELGITVRFVEKLVERKVIPVIKISRRCIRFSLPRVEAALARLELAEMGR